MTLKNRINALEKLKPEPWIDVPIMITIRDYRRGATPIPVDRFTLTAGTKKLDINRLPEESEKAFIKRAKQIGQQHIVKPVSRRDVQPGVILFQKIGNNP